MDADLIERFDRLRCKIKLRPTYDGRALKAGALMLDGLEATLFASWVCEDDENYPGEWALMPVDEATGAKFHEAGVAWIASGDVEVLEDER